MLPEADSYEAMRAAFRWQIPDRFNIGTAICDRWADAEPDREAITYVAEDGTATRVSYGELKALSNRMANLFRARGLERGDRVGVLLPQSVETAAAHIAARRRRLGPWRREQDRATSRQKDLATLARLGFSYAVARAVIDGDAESAP